MIGGRVLDAPTLAGFAGELPYPQALVWTAVQEDIVLAVPAAALTSAWARTPAGVHDALDVLLGLPNTVVEPLDRDAAGEVGPLLAGGDVDAVRAGQVVHSGIRRGWPVVTAEPAPLRAIDPRVEIDELP
ncbi:MAG: hypothetical protein ACRDT2_05690 [Natronosporangium sp.]